MSEQQKKLLVIDGKSIFYRAYYSFSLSSGETPTGAVFGFFRIVFDIIRKVNPDDIVIAWDKPKTNIRGRKKIYALYKAGRKKPEMDFYEQIPVLMEILKVLKWQVLEYDDYEADDIMATIAKEMASGELEVDLVSSDMDLLQALGDHVQVWLPKTGAKVIDRFDEKSFSEKYGIRYDQFLDLKSLKGDSSDNLPGVPGIGEKGATKLLHEYGSLDEIYRQLDNVKPFSLQERLRKGRDDAYLTKQVATLQCDAPIRDFDLGKSGVWGFDNSAAKEAFLKYEMKSLTERLDKESLMKSPMKKVKAAPKAKQMDILGDGDRVDHFIAKEGGKEILVAVDLKECYKNKPELVRYNEGNLVYDLRQAGFLLSAGRKPKIVAGGEDNLRAVFKEQRRQFAVMPKVWNVAHELDFPLAYVLYKMENTGMKIDFAYFEKLGGEFEKRMRNIEKAIYEMAGKEFNVGSPMQLSEVLFDELKLPTERIKKVAKFYSTSESELLKIKNDHPIVLSILEYREVAKLVGTYVKPLPKLADEGGRIHTTFSQSTTSTGRLSSSDPNLQNIPTRTELGKKVRGGFVASPGYKLISADYSQFELRLVAFLAGDKDMIKAFNDGVDIHVQTASMIFNVPMEKVTGDQRAAAKTINFGVLYGMGPKALSASTGMSFAEASEFIRKYFEVRKPVADYINRLRREAEDNGFVETFYGRRKDTGRVKSQSMMMRAAEMRAAVNMPIQGTEADVMKMAMIEIEKQIDGGVFGDTKQIMQVHDSIMLEVPSAGAEVIGKKLREIMMGVAPEIKVRLDVDVRLGDNWAEI